VRGTFKLARCGHWGEELRSGARIVQKRAYIGPKRPGFWKKNTRSK